jgi:hypothetical protein
MNCRTWLLIVGLCSCGGVPAAEPPSRPGIDAPELARLGPFPVGVRLVKLVQQDQPNVLRFDPTKGVAPSEDRTLAVDVWYPAVQARDAVAETYHASLSSEPPAPPAEFSIPALAVRDAPVVPARHPLVIVSHGYSNATVALSWLTENLASKGYVVAAIRLEARSRWIAPTLCAGRLRARCRDRRKRPRRRRDIPGWRRHVAGMGRRHRRHPRAAVADCWRQ